jgi:hypothetical protein
MTPPERGKSRAQHRLAEPPDYGMAAEPLLRGLLERGDLRRGVLADVEVALADVERLRARIRKAPHASHCEAGASLFPGPCNCWKRNA